jgi:hypothetical protein
MEPKINQQLSNNKYGRAKECRPSGVSKAEATHSHVTGFIPLKERKCYVPVSVSAK